MKVDHICVNYGTPLFRELFLALKKYNIEQTVFYPRNKRNNIINEEIPYRLHSPLVLNLLTKLSLRRKTRTMHHWYDPLFKEHAPDVIHAHTLFSDGSLANLYYETFGTPFIVALRSTDLDTVLKYKPWLIKTGFKILKNAKFIVFISPSLKLKFQERFGNSFESKSLIIPNGINQNYFATQKYKERKVHTPLRLLYVGNFWRLKNVPTLIRFIKNKQAELHIVGKGGNEEKKVLELIEKSDNIHYLGRIDDPVRLSEIYQDHDIFIMISKRETFGLVYIEAMSQGLPLIYSRGTGIDGLFKEGEVGFGVYPNSPLDLDQAITKIVSDYENIAKRCRVKAEEFNWQSVSEQYIEVYKKSLS